VRPREVARVVLEANGAPVIRRIKDATLQPHPPLRTGLDSFPSSALAGRRGVVPATAVKPIVGLTDGIETLTPIDSSPYSLGGMFQFMHGATSWYCTGDSRRG